MCLNRPVVDNLSPEVQTYITTLETDLEEQKNRIADLEIMLQNMQRMLFGKKSEKMVSQVPVNAGEQMSMFNEAEQDADSEVPDPLAVEEVKCRILWLLRKSKSLHIKGKRIPEKSCSASFRCSRKTICWILPPGIVTSADSQWTSLARNW